MEPVCNQGLQSTVTIFRLVLIIKHVIMCMYMYYNVAGDQDTVRSYLSERSSPP